MNIFEELKKKKCLGCSNHNQIEKNLKKIISLCRKELKKKLCEACGNKDNLIGHYECRIIDEVLGEKDT